MDLLAPVAGAASALAFADPSVQQVVPEAPIMNPRRLAGTQTLEGHARAVTDMVFTARGDTIWTSGLDATVRHFPIDGITGSDVSAL